MLGRDPDLTIGLLVALISFLGGLLARAIIARKGLTWDNILADMLISAGIGLLVTTVGVPTVAIVRETVQGHPLASALAHFDGHTLEFTILIGGLGSIFIAVREYIRRVTAADP